MTDRIIDNPEEEIEYHPDFDFPDEGESDPDMPEDNTADNQ